MADTAVMSALRTGTEERQTDQQIAMALQALSMRQRQEAAKEQEQAQQKKMQAAAWTGSQQMASPPPVPQPQAMAPGQPSVPMQPPQGPPPGPPPQAQPQQAPPPPAMPPQGWKPSMAAPPSLGGQPPPGSAPGQIGAPPAPNTGVDMPQIRDPKEIIKTVSAMQIPDDQKWEVAQAMGEMLSKQNKAVLEQWQISQQAKKAAAAAAKETEAAGLRKLFGGMDPTPEMKNAYFATGDLDKAKALAQRLEEKKTTFAANAPGAGGGYGEEFDKLNPKQQAAVDWYATMSMGGDQTWRTGLSRIKGGAELIKAVDEYVPIKAGEIGLSAADVGTNKAKRVASQAALTQNTKDIAAIEPFANMLDQNAAILKDLATKVVKTNAPFANKSINYLQTHAGNSPDLAEYLAQMRLVQTEAARVITNPRLVGQLTDSARGELEEIVNGSMTLDSTDRVVDRLVNDSQRRVSNMKAQQKSLEGNIKGMMSGKDESTPAPAAVAKGGTKTVTTKAEYDALPVGTHFLDKDGKEWVRH